MAKRTKYLTAQGDEKAEVRINKYLSEAGICSRREADRYILEGKIQIDGITAVMGSKVGKSSRVTFEGKPVRKEERLVLIAFNKPEGIVSTTASDEPDNIVDFIQYGMRIYPIGRLDKDSDGLILLTNDGNIVNKILRAENYHEKEYIVTVNKEITREFLSRMSEGVPVLDKITKPCEVFPVDRFTFRIILTQGLNRQIRRMCEYFGYRVTELTRIRIMNINLGRLKPGSWRNVTEKEIEEMNRLIQSGGSGQRKQAADERVQAKSAGTDTRQRRQSAEAARRYQKQRSEQGDRPRKQPSEQSGRPRKQFSEQGDKPRKQPSGQSDRPRKQPSGQSGRPRKQFSDRGKPQERLPGADKDKYKRR